MRARLGMFALTLGCIAAPAAAQVAASAVRADGASVPLRVFSPEGGGPCPPTLIYSHGLGGSEKGPAELADALAKRGMRTIFMGHKESGWPQLRAALPGGKAAVIAAAREPASHAARFADLAAALGEATRQCRPRFLALAGHSMGAQTAMMEAGAQARIDVTGQDRFDAYVALSPQGVGSAFAQGAWDRVRKPVLMVTGTRDTSETEDYSSRRAAFEGLPPGAKRLVVIPGAGHLQIGGFGPGAAAVQKHVAEAMAEFLGEAAAGHVGISRLTGVETRDK